MVTASSARYQVKGCLRLHANPGRTKLDEIRTISFLLTFCPRYNPKITRLIQCHPRKQFSATLLMTSRSFCLALRMHSPKVLLRTKSDLQAWQLGCPLVVHLCQCAAVQDEFAEADVGAAAATAAAAATEAGELQVWTTALSCSTSCTLCTSFCTT